MKCLQCESERIVKNVRAINYGHGGLRYDLRLLGYNNPDAWIFKDSYELVLKANVCADCGFVMFSVSIEDAQKLEYHQNKKS